MGEGQAGVPVDGALGEAEEGAGGGGAGRCTRVVATVAVIASGPTRPIRTAKMPHNPIGPSAHHAPVMLASGGIVPFHTDVYFLRIFG